MARRSPARASVLRRLALESLEPRALMTTLPPPVVSTLRDVSQTQGDESAPSIAIDRNNPLKLAMTWTSIDPKRAPGPQVLVQAAFSNDGGNNWSTPIFVGGQIFDPATTNPVVLYGQAVADGIAFDRNDNVYILVTQNNSVANTSGSLLLNKFDFSGNQATQIISNQILTQWLPSNGDQVVDASLAVDDNVKTFTDTLDSGKSITQTDLSSGNVYVAWTSIDVRPAATPANNFYNPNRIVLEGSSDGGVTFSPPVTINDNGNFGVQRNAAPRLAVSQGRAPRAAGTNGPTDSGDPGLPGGQVSIIWDDFGTGSQNSPPLDEIKVDRISGGVAETVKSAGGPIADAVNPGSGPHIPATTTFPVAVDITDPRFTAATNLNVTVNLVHPAIQELKIELLGPGGVDIVLLNNQTDAAGNNNTFRGATGANLGIAPDGEAVGTIFDDNATRNIVDINAAGNGRGAAAPFLGHFQPEADLFSPGSLTAAVNGLTAAQLNGTWTLKVTDFRNGNVGRLVGWSLQFASGISRSAGDFNTNVATTFVRGNIGGNFALDAAINPGGIGPAPTLAADNTLGGFSPYQGRLYATYVDHLQFNGNPADHTVIELVHSDDGGLNWSTPVQVNDDIAVNDGYTEGGFNSGRPHFQPQVAVDDATGTVGLSWLDARNDAARLRVATYLATSIDGGTTFSSQSPDPNTPAVQTDSSGNPTSWQVFANPPQVATDAITGQPVLIGPIPDNQSSGNGNREATFGFGTHQGLAFYGGRLHPAWASTIPDTTVNGQMFSGGLDNKARLDIRTAIATVAAGPRIISSTMGPVGEPGDTVNTTRTADGTPIANAFIVTFDRPVDPNTFAPDDVSVTFRDTTTGNLTGGPVPVISVTPLDLGYFGPAKAHGATQFRVNFAPRSAPGTYSYTVGPNISDRIRGPIVTVVNVNPVGPRQLLTSPDTNHFIPDLTTITSPLPITGFPSNQVIQDIKVKLNINHTYDGDLVITLIAPDGRRVVLVANRGPGEQNFTNTVFDDTAAIAIGDPTAFGPYTGSFRPEQALGQLRGEPINGTWKLEVADTPFYGPGDVGTLLNWSLDFQPGVVTGTTAVGSTGNPMDQESNAIPGEVTDVYATPRPLGGVPGVAPYDQNTLPLIVPGPHVQSTHVPGNPTTSDNLVLNRTTSALDVTFDRDMSVDSFTADQVLRIMGPAGLVSAPYSVAAAYNSANVNVAIPAGGTINSTLVVPDDNGLFSIQNLGVRLDITHAHDADLTAVLIAPDGTRITLFQGAGGTSGKNFTDTLLDDRATTPIAQGGAPFNGSFQPLQKLAALAGKQLRGTWTLQITSSNPGGAAGVLNAWSLEATALPGQGAYARTFRVEFPQQQLSGTYVATLGPNIRSRNGDLMDANLNAGLDLLKGTASSGPTIPVTFNSTNVPVSTIGLKTVTSTLVVPDNFLVAGLTLTLNITYPNDPDLEGTLIAPDGTRIKLFTNVGATGTLANFTNTTFDDAAATPIQNGGPPFFGRFNPQQPLSNLIGKNAGGVWTLEIKNDAAGNTGQINSWSLTIQKPVPISGLGEPAADRSTASFRIFTMDPTNPLASNTWTAVGPAANNSGGNSGRIGGLAVDPSDPSGNTVYVGGASGGIWKTTNFLTTNPGGPTYIPLTDFGPTFAINIGSIAVFGRNNDPNQSIIFAATGEGDAGSTGVGFLRSMDGGATWTLLDSLNNVDSGGNELPFAQRGHEFVGTTSFKVLVDPKPSPTGDVIVYAALSGNNGGVYRSLDTGKTWQLMRGGQATDIALDLSSGTGAPGGNLQILYGAFRGDGVYFSPNRGQVWSPMTGGVGDPLIQDAETNPHNAIPVTAPVDTPNGGKGRIVLAKPSPTVTGNPVEDVQYQGWLYAFVATPGGLTNGLYLTKDFGQNWTRIRIPTLPPVTGGGSNPLVRAVPSNDPNNPDYDVLGNATFAQGNYDIAMAVDPTNPSVVYIGGTADGQPTGLLRVDVAQLADPHALVPYNNGAPDGGQTTVNTTGPLTLKRPTGNNNAPPQPFFNLIRDPNNPFLANATIQVRNSQRFNNTGMGARWVPFDLGGTDQHRFITTVDPLTGHARLIIGDDQGVYTAVDDGTGGVIDGIGTAPTVSGARSGNLQITQFYYGASQPSNAAAQVAQALFYGQAQDDGSPQSDPNVLTNGNIGWTGPTGDGTGVATDQTFGYGSSNTNNRNHATVDRFNWPCCGGNGTNFFQVSTDGGPGIGRTFGLLQQSLPGNTPDPQWPYVGGFNFSVNPLNGDQVLLSSAVGRLFRTENQGLFWSVIAEPAALDGTNVQAPAFGAPDPNGPGGVGNLDNFLYAGTAGGNIFVTQTGGGSNGGNAWVKTFGLDGSAVQAIIPNPTRGSHEAYAVTAGGVYHIANSTVANATWQNITGTGVGNIFNLTHQIFGDAQLGDDKLVRSLSSLAVDWRYVIPGPNNTTFPILYVGGQGGVFRSIDNGVTWTAFPDNTLNNTPAPPGNGGGMPVAAVSDLDLALGNVNPTTGRPDVSTGPNVLLATTYGRGSFAIRLAPLVFVNSLKLSTTLPAPGGSDSSKGLNVTNVTRPVFEGLSAQSAFGQVITVQIIDETNPTNPVVIGTGQTDTTGHFAVQVNPGYFKSDGSTDGLKTIGLQATDQAGTKGNIATLQFTLKTLPPAAPGTPHLEALSDTPLPGDPAYVKGVTDADGITYIDGSNGVSPIFDVTSVEPSTTIITLFRNGVAVGQRTSGGPITDVGPIPDGTYTYTASQTDLAGNVSPLSGATTVTYVTVPPPQPAPPILLAADDSSHGQGITNVRRPHLTGVAVPGGTILLVDAANNVIGVAPIASNGSYTVQPTQPLVSGIYNLRVRDEDIAGNVSTSSAPLTITLIVTNPPKPALTLDPEDINAQVPIGGVLTFVTNDNHPNLIGSVIPSQGLSIDLLSVDGKNTPIATVTPATDGNFQIQFPSNQTLADGTYTIFVQARDLAGNTTLSDPIHLQVLTQGPTDRPILGLSPADDTGIKGDGVTVIRRPHLIGTTKLASAKIEILQVVPGQTTGPVLATTTSSDTADALGNYSFIAQLPQDLVNGTIGLQAVALDIAGNASPPSATFTLKIASVLGDYDVDGQADLATFRPTNAFWSLYQSTVGPQGALLGDPRYATIPYQGDFNGDGKTDLVAVNPATMVWTVQSAAGVKTLQFGAPNVDIAAPADYAGNGLTEYATYRPTTGQWSILGNVGSVVGPMVTPAAPIPGVTFAEPVPGDYEGVGHAELATYQPSTGVWTIQASPGSPARTFAFGAPNIDVPVPGDYFGDGKTDIAIYRPITGQWFIWHNLNVANPSSSGANLVIIQFGIPNLDIPVPRDYEGIGRTELALFRPTTAQWIIPLSTGAVRVQQFGAANLDVPVPAPYEYRHPKAASPTVRVASFSSPSTDLGATAGATAAGTLNFGKQAASFSVGTSSSPTRSTSNITSGTGAGAVLASHGRRGLVHDGGHHPTNAVHHRVHGGVSRPKSGRRG